MRFNDIVYGQTYIAEPVFVDLLNSAAMVRLKGVCQFGVYPLETYFKPIYSRYEHSLGTAILLRRLGANLSEQIAGLLHDVAHTAFSHAADSVFLEDVTQQDYHEKNFNRLVSNSEIPAILLKHNIDRDAVLKLSNFELLEQPVPELCADRLDYSLREFAYWADPQSVEPLLAGLLVRAGKIAFKNYELARLYAYGFLKLQLEHWTNPERMAREEIFFQTIKKAYQRNYLTGDDFYLDDSAFLEKLLAIKDLEIQNGLGILSGSQKFKPSTSDFSSQKIPRKFRYVDPFFLDHGILCRLSEQDQLFADKIALEKVACERGFDFNYS